MRLHDTRVGGHRLAWLQQQHIADDDLARIEGHRFAAAQHSRRVRPQAAQARHRLLGLAFGDEADAAVGGEHGADRRGIEVSARAERQRGRRAEQRDRHRAELIEQDLERAAPGHVGDLVGAITLAPGRGFGRAQALIERKRRSVSALSPRFSK